MPIMLVSIKKKKSFHKNVVFVEYINYGVSCPISHLMQGVKA